MLRIKVEMELLPITQEVKIMARIDMDSIRHLVKDRNTIHEKVYTTYSEFEANGEKYVQIDTYGRSDRDLPGKISQSFQFDRESAVFMVKLLAKEFDLSFGIFK